MEYKWIALSVTTVAVLMVGIDTRIVIVGLPQIAQQLSADVEQSIWITQAYVFTNTVLLLLIGRLADLFGRVRLFIYGFAVFTLGSALTSLGQTPIQVILFRAVQGAGASLILANSVAIVTDVSPKNQLGFSLGINQIAVRIGALTGLTLSGLILSFLDWHALFYINIPIGIFGTFWAARQLKETPHSRSGATVDFLGFGVFRLSALSSARNYVYHLWHQPCPSGLRPLSPLRHHPHPLHHRRAPRSPAVSRLEHLQDSRIYWWHGCPSFQLSHLGCGSAPP